ncbi:MAG: FG-GAP-like repeat-containing protein [Chloroflexota bacterium]
MLTKDSLGNYRYIPATWRGTIDNIAPQIVLTSTEITDNIAQISCEAYDYNLDLNSWACPATGELSLQYGNEDWFSQIFSGTNQLVGLTSTSQNSLVTGDYSLTACDIFDNCSSVTAFVIDQFEEDTASNIPGIYDGEAHWGDYDNDGDMDILLTGCLDTDSCDAPIAHVYENTAATFTLAYSLTGQNDQSYVWQADGGSTWGDYDGDGDLDIVLSGHRGGGVVNTTLYENTGAGFDSGTLITNEAAAVAWLDFDNDNDLDLAVGDLTFENTGAGFNQIFDPYIDVDVEGGRPTTVFAYADFDNDGLEDYLLNGSSNRSNGGQLLVYRNTGDDFELVHSSPGTLRGTAEWADYDNDGDLDILLSGCDKGNCNSQTTYIYENRTIVQDGFAVNNAPNTPSNLAANVVGTQITLSWDKSTDTETPTDGLQYNLYLGSASDKSAERSPLALIGGSDEGWQLQPGFTNLVATNGYSLNLTVPGDYIWSVQAVDTGFAGSPWATEGSFTIAGADLEIEKSANQLTAQNGDSLQYTIVFTNNGPDLINDAIITDSVPTELTNISYQSSGVTLTEVSTNPFVWQVASMASGDSGTITINAQVASDFSYIGNIAEISSTSYDGHPGNNYAQAMVYPPNASGNTCTFYPNVVLSDNPTAFWRLSDAGNIARNLGSVGSVIDGTYQNGTTLGDGLIWQDPSLGANFDGVDDHILIPNDSGLSGETIAKTVELWFKTAPNLQPGDNGPRTYMLYEQGHSGHGVNLFVRAFDTGDEINYILVVTVAGTGNKTTRTVAVIEADTIYHTALVHDQGRLTVYLDGEAIFDDTGYASKIENHNDGDIRIGGNGGTLITIWEETALFPFHGTIDDVAVYNHALSADRVSAHYSACQAVDLGISKTDTARRLTIGDSITYTISFVNQGYETANNITISDPVSDFLTNTTWSADPGLGLSLTADTTYEWTLPSLASGASGTIIVSGQISFSETIDNDTTVINTASISTTSDEFNLNNNSASAEVVAAPPIPEPIDPLFILDSGASDDIQGVYYSDVTWGDYDGDGLVDLLINGLTGVFKMARIYHNDGGSFTDIGAGLPGTQEGSVDWGDYDNDGDLDILLTGNAGSSKLALVYRNDNGTFTNINAGLTGIYRGNAEWGDYDNDDDLDILLTGYTGSVQISTIYRNDNGTFTDINAGLPGVYLSSSTWGDYDNDDLLDVLISGLDNSNAAIATVYRNQGGDTFSAVSLTLPSIHNSTSSAIAWGDYDADGDDDLLLTGTQNAQPTSIIYRNDNGSLVDIQAGLIGVSAGSVDWGDYDGDGDLDALISGANADETLLYRNEGNDTFTLAAEEEFPALSQSAVAWVDYDGDGDLDALLTGLSGSTPIAQIWRNPSPVVAFNIDTATVNETAGSISIDVVLDQIVEETVTVDYATQDDTATAGSDYTFMAGTVSISAGNTTGTITIDILDDVLNDGDETFTISLSNASGAILGLPKTATITIEDDERPIGVLLSTSTFSVTEAGVTDSYTMALVSEPTDDVTITISPDGETTVNPTSVTFTPANWNVPQTVTIIAVDDNRVEGDHTSTISHSASSNDNNYDGVTVDSITTAIEDNDTANMLLTPTNLGVTEGGAVDNYTLVLTSEPSDAVTITVSTDSQVTANPTTVIFTALNWSENQTVTVTAVDDDLVEGVHASTINHTVSSNDGDYNGFSLSNVSISVTDNDSAGVSVNPTGLTISEDGLTDDYQLLLTAQPTEDVLVTVNSDSNANANPSAVTFTPLNWNVVQTVSVSAVNDDLIEGTHVSTLTHSVSSSDSSFNGLATSTVSANITDNDSAGVTLSTLAISIDEDGTTDNYTLQLDAQPRDTVTITLTSDAQSLVVPNVVTFTAANWDNTQNVVVSAIDDPVIEGTHTSTITHVSTSNDGDFDSLGIGDVIATIGDNDVAGVTLSATRLNVDEAGASDSYTLVLDSQPQANVTVNLTGDSQISLSTPSINFTNLNWNTPQTLTVNAVDDAAQEGSHTATINHTVSSGDLDFDSLAVSDVTVNIIDNDTAGVSINPGTVNVTEGGVIDTYNVVLTTLPTNNVTITIASDSQVTLSTATLVFTPAIWNITQVVTVTAINDNIAEGTHNSTISHTVSSADGDYDGFGANSVTANITDNETAGVNLSTTSVAITEGGSGGTYGITLSSEPIDVVTITVSSDAETIFSPVSLVFTTTTWNITQTVTITAVNDDRAEGLHSSTVTHTVVSGDVDYDGSNINDVTLNISDDDVVGVTLNKIAASVTEGGATDTYTVVLDSEPSDNVTINISTDGETTVNPNSLVYTIGTWDTTQVVTITAVDDDSVEAPHLSIISHNATSSDSDYNGASITIDTITATVTDDDVAGVDLIPTTVAVDEDGTTAIYSLTLTSQPTDPVTVTVAPDGQTSVNTTTVVFTSINWDIGQDVTVSAIDDGLIEGLHTSTINHSAVSADSIYNGLAIGSVTANITDNDVAGVIFDPTTVSVTEGGSTASYDVSLVGGPTSPVTLTITTDGQTSTSPTSLVFTTSNWNLTQAVTVTAVDDVVDEGVLGHNSLVSHAISSADASYSMLPAQVLTATITDNDTAGIVISPTSISLNESVLTATQIYSVVLVTEPTDTVTVTVGTDGETTVSPTSLTFTAITWNIAQTITATVIDDTSIEGPHIGTISHTVNSNDGNYNDFIASNVLATILDNDGVYQDVAEAISYTLVYALDIPLNADYNATLPNYFIDNSADITDFDRVAYYMLLDDEYVYASMPAFTTNINHIGVPVQSLGITFTTVTDDLNFTVNGGFSRTGVQGGLEFWPNDYSPDSRPETVDEFGNSIGNPGFDWSDTPLISSGNYSGSLQIAYLQDRSDENFCCTLMAWNNWDSPAVDDVGFEGKVPAFNTSQTGDFTNFANTGDYVTRTLYILVREGIGNNRAAPRDSTSDTNQLAGRGAATRPEKVIITNAEILAEFDTLNEQVRSDQSARLALPEPEPIEENVTVESLALARGIDVNQTVNNAGPRQAQVVGNAASRLILARAATTNIETSRILTPTFPAAFTSTQPIALGGYVASGQNVASLDVTIDAVSIDNIIVSAGLTETTWTSSWTPSTEGIYTLEARLTTGASQIIVDPTETLLYIDLTDPVVSISTPSINASNFQAGQISITGIATDTVGVQSVEARVDGGDWQIAQLAHNNGGGADIVDYNVDLPIDIQDVPANSSYVVDVRVTDRGGHQVTLQRTLAADVVAPAPPLVTLEAAGQTVRQNGPIDWAENPTLEVQWNAAVDPNGIGAYQVEWLEYAGDTLQTVQNVILGNTQLSHTYAASEGQKLAVRVTVIDGFGNTSSQFFGPVYVDFETTPVYYDNSFAYAGWLENSCNLIGLDSRLAQATGAQNQRFYTSWDAAGLRLSWQGANWQTEGDLFIYLDTQPGGSTVAYNPYPVSSVSTAIFLPNNLSADYVIWVQEDDGSGATLMQWDGSQWQAVADPWAYRFEADLASPQTDIYIPFTTLGITDPNSQTLGLVAIASEEDALKLWAAMPQANSLNSETIVGSATSSDVELFSLLRGYQWTTLSTDICPGAGNFQGLQVEATLTPSSEGVGYGLFADHVIAGYPKLFPDIADWDTATAQLCSGQAVQGRGTVPVLPALCQRDAVGTANDFFNPTRDLVGIFNTQPDTVADGETLNLSLKLQNTGSTLSEGVTALVVADRLLTLPSGSLIGDQYEQQVNIGTLAVGESREVNFQAVIDAAFNAGQSDAWTRLYIIFYDNTGSRTAPSEILYLNHRLDQDGPNYVEVTSPVSLIGAGRQAINGFVADQSPVPTIVLDIDGQETNCQNETGAAEWRCEVDLGSRNDGDIINIRVKAIDEHGQESDWFDVAPLTVDTTSPTLQTTNVTARNFDGGLIGPNDTVLLGEAFDNRQLDRLEVCQDGRCKTTSIQQPDGLDEQSLYRYTDQPEAPLLIGQSNACSGGTVLARSFNVADSFTIADLDISLNIEHPFRNDLQVSLQSPAGTRVELINNAAATANIDLTLDDSARRSIAQTDDGVAHDIAIPFYDRSRQPDTGLLYTFRDENAQGIWSLEICDQAPNEDDGLYQSAQLIFLAQVLEADSQGNWRYKLDLPPNVENVQQSLTLYAYDILGNRSDALNLSYTVDTKPPVLTVDEVADLGLSTEVFTVSGTVNDANAATMRISIRTPNGQLVGDRIAINDGSWIYTTTSRLARPGIYQVWVEAKDEAGNQAFAGLYEVTRLADFKQIHLPLLFRNYAPSTPSVSSTIYLPVVAKNSVGATTPTTNIDMYLPLMGNSGTGRLPEGRPAPILR